MDTYKISESEQNQYDELEKNFINAETPYDRLLVLRSAIETIKTLRELNYQYAIKILGDEDGD
jgi:hypothetical protein